jgi:hypothetical protein
VAGVALGWLLAKPFVTSIIIGAKRTDQLRENLAAADIRLTEDELKQLDEVSSLPPEYPGWIVPHQNSNRLENVPRPFAAYTQASAALVFNRPAKASAVGFGGGVSGRENDFVSTD